MWVMHSKVTHRPWCLTFYIGSVEIANVTFIGKRQPWLHINGQVTGPFESVSAAMTEMHRLLNSPPDHVERPDPDIRD